MKFWKLATAATVIMASSSANAALIERLGGLAYYDDVADLTWSANANIAGSMTWQQANDWAADLTIGGIGGWRLADTLQPDASCSFGYNCIGSEMGNLFYNVLGNSAGSLTNTGPFSNVQSFIYWSATEYATDPQDLAWSFNMNDGGQFGTYKVYDDRYAWAVQSGDVSAVPVPAAVWLFGSGLIGLVGLARRKR